MATKADIMHVTCRTQVKSVTMRNNWDYLKMILFFLSCHMGLIHNQRIWEKTKSTNMNMETVKEKYKTLMCFLK